MTNDQCEVLSRFFDGEAVDEEALVESLSQPGASELLVGFSRLRRAIRSDLGEPDAPFWDSMRRQLRRSRFGRLFERRLVWAAMTAGVVLAAASAGYSVRPWLDGVRDGAPRPHVTAPADTTAGADRTKASPTPHAPAGGQPALGPVIPHAGRRVPFAEWREHRASN